MANNRVYLRCTDPDCNKWLYIAKYMSDQWYDFRDADMALFIADHWSCKPYQRSVRLAYESDPDQASWCRAENKWDPDAARAFTTVERG